MDTLDIAAIRRDLGLERFQEYYRRTFESVETLTLTVYHDAPCCDCTAEGRGRDLPRVRRLGLVLLCDDHLVPRLKVRAANAG